MPLSNTQIGASLRGDLSSALDLGTALFSTNLSRGTAFDNGTGAGQADKIWTDTRTLAASGSEDLALRAVLLDAFGVAVSFFRIKAIMVFANSANTNNVVVGANIAANGWATLIGPAGASGGTITLRPGAGFCAFAGAGDATAYAAASADLLHVANSAGGTSVTYDIALIGCSA